MGAGAIKRTGPVAMSAALTTNIFNNASALIYNRIKRIHVVNKTGVAATFSLWLGATGGNAAGTELYTAQTVAANSVFDGFMDERMDSTDFLVGGASAGTTLTIVIDREEFAV
jgi:hypothetical protein